MPYFVALRFNPRRGICRTGAPKAACIEVGCTIVLVHVVLECCVKPTVERNAQLTGLRVARELDRIAELRGYPCMIVSDNVLRQEIWRSEGQQVSIH